MTKKPYQRTEKWWLISVVLFFLLYNMPGVPPYGSINGALWHGALTLIPLWICIYGGLYLTTKQRKLANVHHQDKSTDRGGDNHVK